MNVAISDDVHNNTLNIPIAYVGPYLEYAKDYRADGIMLHPLISCRPATYMLMHKRNLLMELYKVPSLVVEGDIIDLRVFNREEALAKIEAFVETMEYYREIREKEGLQ